jgi:hypothetical protein
VAICQEQDLEIQSASKWAAGLEAMVMCLGIERSQKATIYSTCDRTHEDIRVLRPSLDCSAHSCLDCEGRRQTISAATWLIPLCTHQRGCPPQISLSRIDTLEKQCSHMYLQGSLIMAEACRTAEHKPYLRSIHGALTASGIRRLAQQQSLIQSNRGGLRK